jgi:hypothetical protein
MGHTKLCCLKRFSFFPRKIRLMETRVNFKSSWVVPTCLIYNYIIEVYICTYSLNNTVCLETFWEVSGKVKIFLFSAACKLALGPT